MSDWPFDAPENASVLSAGRVVDGGAPILRVTHDPDCGMWQFLTDGPVGAGDAVVVSLREVYDFDPSVGELADLPPDWTAERVAPGQPWRRLPRCED